MRDSSPEVPLEVLFPESPAIPSRPNKVVESIGREANESYLNEIRNCGTCRALREELRELELHHNHEVDRLRRDYVNETTAKCAKPTGEDVLNLHNEILCGQYSIQKLESELDKTQHELSYLQTEYALMNTELINLVDRLKKQDQELDEHQGIVKEFNKLKKDHQRAQDELVTCKRENHNLTHEKQESHRFYESSLNVAYMEAHRLKDEISCLQSSFEAERFHWKSNLDSERNRVRMMTQVQNESFDSERSLKHLENCMVKNIELFGTCAADHPAKTKSSKSSVQVFNLGGSPTRMPKLQSDLMNTTFKWEASMREVSALEGMHDKVSNKMREQLEERVEDLYLEKQNLNSLIRRAHA